MLFCSLFKLVPFFWSLKSAMKNVSMYSISSIYYPGLPSFFCMVLQFSSSLHTVPTCTVLHNEDILGHFNVTKQYMKCAFQEKETKCYILCCMYIFVLEIDC